MHADLAMCERYEDAERAQGKRAADIRCLAVNADSLDADQTRTKPVSALDTKSSHQSLVGDKDPNDTSPPPC